LDSPRILYLLGEKFGAAYLARKGDVLAVLLDGHTAYILVERVDKPTDN
jgi:uncharacterized protein (DUF1330 family)